VGTTGAERKRRERSQVQRPGRNGPLIMLYRKFFIVSNEKKFDSHKGKRGRKNNDEVKKHEWKQLGLLDD